MTLKLRRGLEADRASITPAEGELIYTTDEKKLFVGDGTTAGGNAVDTTGGGNGGTPSSISNFGVELIADGELSGLVFNKDNTTVGTLNASGTDFEINSQGDLVLLSKQMRAGIGLTSGAYQQGVQFDFLSDAGNIEGGATALTDATSVRMPAMLPWTQYVAAGYIIQFADNSTKTITGVREADGYLYADFEGAVTLDPAYPLTITSPDYAAEIPPFVNIRSGFSQFNFKDDGSIEFPDGSVQTTAAVTPTGPTFADYSAMDVGDSNMSVDLTKVTHLLANLNGNPEANRRYYLSAGTEGQTIYFMPGNGYNGNDSVFWVDSYAVYSNGGYTSGSGVVKMFDSDTGLQTLVTATYLAGMWHFFGPVTV